MKGLSKNNEKILNSIKFLIGIALAIWLFMSYSVSFRKIELFGAICWSLYAIMHFIDFSLDEKFEKMEKEGNNNVDEIERKDQ